MKKFLFLAMLAALTACDNSPKIFIGYVVGKTYMPEHMCHDEEVKLQEEAGLNYVHVAVPARHHHSLQEAEWKIYVANRERVQEFNVHPEAYPTYIVGHKVRMIYD